jgi:hypothetical protein
MRYVGLVRSCNVVVPASCASGASTAAASAAGGLRACKVFQQRRTLNIDSSVLVGNSVQLRDLFKKVAEVFDNHCEQFYQLHIVCAVIWHG